MKLHKERHAQRSSFICSSRQVVEASLATVHGIRSCLQQHLQSGHALQMPQAMYIAGRIEELRYLTKQLHRRGDVERTRSLVRIRHMLRNRLLRLMALEGIDATVTAVRS
ncbi:MAG: hypothetical protein WCX29_04000 [Candidatus Peribacteraceae bacterium]|jgi:hypothetical protein|nr:hypothetical protein [Candidatus Peribacteria bacterium]